MKLPQLHTETTDLFTVLDLDMVTEPDMDLTPELVTRQFHRLTFLIMDYKLELLLDSGLESVPESVMVSFPNLALVSTVVSSRATKAMDMVTGLEETDF